MGGLVLILGWSGGTGGRPGALSCSVALVFGSFTFFPVHLVVVCWPNEGIQNIYKTNAFLYFLEKMRAPKAAAKDINLQNIWEK